MKAEYSATRQRPEGGPGGLGARAGSERAIPSTDALAGAFAIGQRHLGDDLAAWRPTRVAAAWHKVLGLLEDILIEAVFGRRNYDSESKTEHGIMRRGKKDLKG